jgi:hypothetical protein
MIKWGNRLRICQYGYHWQLDGSSFNRCCVLKSNLGRLKNERERRLLRPVLWMILSVYLFEKIEEK